jgi:hypothetical protein
VALVLDVGTGQVTHEYRDLPGGVFLLGFTRDGKELVTLGKDGIFSFLPLDLVAEARQYARPLTDDERREYGIEGR